MDLIISHAKCPDGLCAALVAKKRYPEAEVLFLDHGVPVPFEAVRGKDVIVLDYSWPSRETNIELHRIAKNFQILDHHKTAREKLAGLDFATFDMTRSGAGLAWDYLFGKDSDYEVTRKNTWEGVACFLPRPWYVDYTEDRDLWNWKLPESKEVNAYLMSLPMTLNGWSHLDTIEPHHAANLGRPVVSHIERYVREAVAEAQRGFIEYSPGRFWTTSVVNIPYMNCSEVGNVLAQTSLVGLTWFERADGQIQFSLRSIGDIDVSQIALRFNGGGHTHAAGFRLGLKEGRELLDTILGRDICSV